MRMRRIATLGSRFHPLDSGTPGLVENMPGGTSRKTAANWRSAPFDLGETSVVRPNRSRTRPHNGQAVPASDGPPLCRTRTRLDHRIPGTAHGTRFGLVRNYVQCLERHPWNSQIHAAAAAIDDGARG